MYDLKIINFSFETITCLPKEISKLINLHELYLDNNSISKLPVEIGKLKDILIFNLENNKILKIPKYLEHMNNNIAI